MTINGYFSFPLYSRNGFFLIVTQQFEVGVVVFLEANYSSILLYLESLLSGMCGVPLNFQVSKNATVARSEALNILISYLHTSRVG